MMQFIAALLAAVVSGYQLRRMVVADNQSPSTPEELEAKAFEANEIRREANLERYALEKHNRIGFMLNANLYNNQRRDNGKAKEQSPKKRVGWGDPYYS